MADDSLELFIKDKKEIKLGALENSPAIPLEWIAAILLLLGYLSSDTTRIIFICLAGVIVFLLLSIYYIRLSSNWRKVHFSFTQKYVRAIGSIVAGDIDDRQRVDTALTLVLMQILPNRNVSGTIISYQTLILRHFDSFMNEKMLLDVLQWAGSPLTDIEKQKLALYFTNKIKDNPYKRVYFIIATIIEIKYGIEEKYRYIQAILQGKAT